MTFGERKKPLRRVSPLARGATDGGWSTFRRVPLSTSGRLPPRERAASPNRARPAPVPAGLRALVIERAEYRCDRCAVYLPGRLYSLQHRRARGGGGRQGGVLNTPENLVLLCGSATSPGCHNRVENVARAEAERQGFVIFGEVIDPGTVPIFRHLRVWVIPTAEGWVSADPIGDVAA